VAGVRAQRQEDPRKFNVVEAWTEARVKGDEISKCVAVYETPGFACYGVWILSLQKCEASTGFKREQRCNHICILER
jgi:hypothetical protein